ncbi:MAG TPA: 4-hydroxy-tetrahydrodipicolinate synthase [Cytophagales bacterium]|nr:4-hydroxy-tetrahydrodipicolinate synthase [Cytophagales bacterium]
MTRSKFVGTGVALVTPFTEKGAIDYEALAKVLEYTAQGGVDYYTVLGTTGESVTLGKKEKQELIRFVVNNNTKKLPILLGIGGNNTQEILESLSELNADGIDAILSVSPYYNKPSQEGIYQHYTKIADNSPLPVILYNVPGRTSSNVSSATTLRLAAHSNIIGIKEACSDLVQSMEIAKSKPSDFLLISGDDVLTLPIIAVGGEGVISVAANAFPKKFTHMVKSCLDADFKEASRSLFEFLEINPLLYSESNPVGVKAALSYLGVCKDEVRLPLVKASEKLKKEIENAINKHQLQ